MRTIQKFSAEKKTVGQVRSFGEKTVDSLVEYQVDSCKEAQCLPDVISFEIDIALPALPEDIKTLFRTCINVTSPENKTTQVGVGGTVNVTSQNTANRSFKCPFLIKAITWCAETWPSMMTIQTFDVPDVLTTTPDLTPGEVPPPALGVQSSLTAGLYDNLALDYLVKYSEWIIQTECDTIVYQGSPGYCRYGQLEFDNVVMDQLQVLNEYNRRSHLNGKKFSVIPSYSVAAGGVTGKPGSKPSLSKVPTTQANYGTGDYRGDDGGLFVMQTPLCTLPQMSVEARLCWRDAYARELEEMIRILSDETLAPSEDLTPSLTNFLYVVYPLIGQATPWYTDSNGEKVQLLVGPVAGQSFLPPNAYNVVTDAQGNPVSAGVLSAFSLKFGPGVIGSNAYAKDELIRIADLAADSGLQKVSEGTTAIPHHKFGFLKIKVSFHGCYVTRSQMKYYFTTYAVKNDVLRELYIDYDQSRTILDRLAVVDGKAVGVAGLPEVIEARDAAKQLDM